MINVSAINTFITWQEISHKNDNICIRQRRNLLISLGKKLWAFIEEPHSVALIFATRNGNVTLAGNGVSLNKRARCTLCDQKKGQKMSIMFLLNVANSMS